MTPGVAPDWSPRGSHLVFGRQRTVCEADSSSRRAVADGRARAEAADAPCDGGEIDLAALYLIRSDGRGLRRLVGARGTGGADSDDQKLGPVWSPTGRQVAFLWNVGERTDLYIVSARGGRKRRLVKDVEWTGGLSWQALRR